MIVLSARTDEADKVAALDAGADDYLTKPFGAGRTAGPRTRAPARRAARAAGRALARVRRRPGRPGRAAQSSSAGCRCT